MTAYNVLNGIFLAKSPLRKASADTRDAAVGRLVKWVCYHCVRA